ncbi:DUF2284 domain-containing protein [Pectinatus frisingensis]|uniref:DUF2284 domain-containing protein n=1 Tax=Pectinatus frisingensis TaxID=865 RepID=UPI003D804152
MMYRIETCIKQVVLTDVLGKYQERERFLRYCKDCHKYNTRWSCPPLDFDPNEYLAPYKYSYLIGIRIFYDAAIIAAANTKEKIRYTSLKTTKTVKKQVSEILLAAEQYTPTTISLSSGGCDFCCRCSRIKNEPCRRPEKMRYSLDAFGINLSKIAKKFLNIELLWNADTLPQYHTLIHALLTKDELSRGAMTLLRSNLMALAQGKF